MAHMAVLDIRDLAVALTEVPAAVHMGCFLHKAEVSSSPSDPLGWMARKERAQYLLQEHSIVYQTAQVFFKKTSPLLLIHKSKT